MNLVENSTIDQEFRQKENVSMHCNIFPEYSEQLQYTLAPFSQSCTQTSFVFVHRSTNVFFLT